MRSMKLVVVLLVLCLSLASLAGCGVSKGKYEALLNEKVILEEKVGILTTARDALKSEYDNLLKEKMDLATKMETLTGRPITVDALKRATDVVNAKRRAVHRLSALRANRPVPM